MDLSYAFTIFFLTLGPLKVLPAFYQLTYEFDESSLHKIAIRGVAFSLLIIIGVVLVSHLALNSWKVSIPAFTLAGGIFLFFSSFKMITNYKMPKSGQTKPPVLKEIVSKQVNILALSPIAVPITISPIGVVAVLVGVGISTSVHKLMELLGLIFFLFVLNLICMWFVRPIVSKIGIPVYSLIGWLFSILQAGLAVQFIVNALHKLFPV